MTPHPPETRMTIEEITAERDQLRYERHLLGIARMTLDLVAAAGPERWDEIRASAEDVAQRIVDEIGHPVTDEPALGPNFRHQIERLKAALNGTGRVTTIDPDDLARHLDKWQDTLEFCAEYFTKSSEAAAAQHCNPKTFYSPICGRLETVLAELQRLRSQLNEEAGR